MLYTPRDAVEADLPRIVEIYNHAVATRTCSCDLDPTTVEARRPSFESQTADHRPFWVAEHASTPVQGAIGDLGLFHFMNQRPGYFITADLATCTRTTRTKAWAPTYCRKPSRGRRRWASKR